MADHHPWPRSKDEGRIHGSEDELELRLSTNEDERKEWFSSKLRVIICQRRDVLDEDDGDK